MLLIDVRTPDQFKEVWRCSHNKDITCALIVHLRLCKAQVTSTRARMHGVHYCSGLHRYCSSDTGHGCAYDKYDKYDKRGAILQGFIEGFENVPLFQPIEGKSAIY
jgi:hypothetical protein